jgi:hypothetical protein
VVAGNQRGLVVSDRGERGRVGGGWRVACEFLDLGEAVVEGGARQARPGHEGEATQRHVEGLRGEAAGIV